MCALPMMYVRLVAVCFLTFLIIEKLPQAIADGLGPGEFGSLTLCPPGGKAFRMAWSLACEMKRRKRSVDDTAATSISDQSNGSENVKADSTATRDKKAAPQGYRPATLTEIQKICCDVGCEIRDLLSYCDPFGPWNSR